MHHKPRSRLVGFDSKHCWHFQRLVVPMETSENTTATIIILWRNFSLEALIGLSPKIILRRNREGESCMEKLIANKKWIMQWLWRFICHSLVPAACQHTRKNFALRKLTGCVIYKIGQFSVGSCNQQSFWGPLLDSIRNLIQRVFKFTSLREKRIYFKSWFWLVLESRSQVELKKHLIWPCKND